MSITSEECIACSQWRFITTDEYVSPVSGETFYFNHCSIHSKIAASRKSKMQFIEGEFVAMHKIAQKMTTRNELLTQQIAELTQQVAELSKKSSSVDTSNYTSSQLLEMAHQLTIAAIAKASEESMAKDEIIARQKRKLETILDTADKIRSEN